MAAEFNNWLKEAAPPLPDAGPIRRTNRALMKERIRHDQPRRRHHYRMGVATAGLALAILFVGQVDNVGSDGWDFESAVQTDILGRTKTVHSRTFGPGIITDATEQQARDILMAEMTREYKILKVIGVELEGRCDWLKRVEIMSEGKPVMTGITAQDPASQEIPEMREMIKSGLYREIITAKKSTLHQATGRVTLEGVTYDVKTWIFPDTPFGTVKYHEGVPIR